MARSYSAGEGRGFAQGGEGRSGAYEAKDPRGAVDSGTPFKEGTEDIFKARVSQIYNEAGFKTTEQIKAQDAKVGLLSLTKDYPNVFMPFELKDSKNPLFKERNYQPWAQWGKYRQGEKNETNLAFERKEIANLGKRLDSGKNRFGEVISSRQLSEFKPMIEEAKKLIAELSAKSKSVINDATAVVDYQEMFKDYFTKSRAGDSYASSQVEPSLERLNREATKANKSIYEWEEKYFRLYSIRDKLNTELETDQEYDGPADQDQSFGGRY